MILQEFNAGCQAPLCGHMCLDFDFVGIMTQCLACNEYHHMKYHLRQSSRIERHLTAFRTLIFLNHSPCETDERNTDSHKQMWKTETETYTIDELLKWLLWYYVEKAWQNNQRKFWSKDFQWEKHFQMFLFLLDYMKKRFRNSVWSGDTTQFKDTDTNLAVHPILRRNGIMTLRWNGFMNSYVNRFSGHY